MTTQETASRLYELCQQGKFSEAQKELYAADATSTEPDHTGSLVTVTGVDAIEAKGKQFQSTIEAHHGGYINPPTVFGSHIFIEMGMDVTMKGMDRMYMKEMCHYVVKDGKIISEQFYY
jgi:hypothetical protein